MRNTLMKNFRTRIGATPLILTSMVKKIYQETTFLPPPLTFTTHTTLWLGEHGHNPIYLKSDHRVTMRNEVSLVFHILKE